MQKFNLRVVVDTMAYSVRRAGNPMSDKICTEAPVRIAALATCRPSTGHDCFLKGIVVQGDLTVSKVFREQLLRYNFVDVISSCSLMHKVKDLIKVKDYWVDVDPTIKSYYMAWLKANPSASDVSVVNNLPLGFRYPLSISTNYLQLKTIYRQRRHHKLLDWQEFCDVVDTLPNSHWITNNKGE